jgi:hypothetical protein
LIRADESCLGPLAPVGIYLWMGSITTSFKYWFVLAERVPSEHLNEVWDDESPFGMITLELDNNLEFGDWDPVTKTFGQVCGSCSLDTDGTLWGECEYYANLGKHISVAVWFLTRMEKYIQATWPAV